MPTPIRNARVLTFDDARREFGHAVELVAAAARDCGSETVILGGAALTGLAAAIGPLPGIRRIDCLQASTAQMAALTEYSRMAGA